LLRVGHGNRIEHPGDAGKRIRSLPAWFAGKETSAPNGRSKAYN
jgi:hypothetical protein